MKVATVKQAAAKRRTKATARPVRPAKSMALPRGKVSAARKAHAASRAGQPGPRLDDEQKTLLLLLLAAGQSASACSKFFQAVGWGALASSTVHHYRGVFAAEIEAAKARRIDEALSSGLALKSERVAALKEHAEQLAMIKFAPDRHGRLWNERAWRLTLEDIATEMGDRKPKDSQAEQTIKVYVGLDPGKV